MSNEYSPPAGSQLSDEHSRRRSSTHNSNPGISERPGSIGGRLRRMSASFQQSDLPEGFLAATSNIAATVLSGAAPPSSAAHTSDPTLPRHILTTFDGYSQANFATGQVQSWQDSAYLQDKDARRISSSNDPNMKAYPSESDIFENGYHFPPSHQWKESLAVGSVAFWAYIRTPIGLFVTIYGLLVVAWGGMLFLLLCNAAPAMCYPDCNDIDSPRRIWIEIDSQVVNALFCVTGFGLAPWRLRDLYYLLKHRLSRDEMAIRRLAGIHRGWFRMQGSEMLAADIGPDTIHSVTLEQNLTGVPFPEKHVPNPPLTGIRAPPTRLWKMEFVIYMFIANTIFQILLSVFMWSMNRFTRPSWSVGLFVALGMVSSACGGIMMFIEGKRVKSIEGVPVSDKDLDRLARDKEMGITHYNNIKDKEPKGQEDKLSIYHRLNLRRIET